MRHKRTALATLAWSAAKRSLRKPVRDLQFATDVLNSRRWLFALYLAKVELGQRCDVRIRSDALTKAETCF